MMIVNAARAAFSTAARPALKNAGVLRIGLVPADGIGREVIPVNLYLALKVVHLHNALQAARDAILALGSHIPKTEFVNLDAGFEYFTRHGEALPDETVQSVHSLLLSPCSYTNQRAATRMRRRTLWRSEVRLPPLKLRMLILPIARRPTKSQAIRPPSSLSARPSTSTLTSDQSSLCVHSPHASSHVAQRALGPQRPK